ncbi:MAG: hypothetical protein HRT42_02590 [Campylobacteraceae bacterium]|nr:hypothetical protein [Campylobacteraceae bacterium]
MQEHNIISLMPDWAFLTVSGLFALVLIFLIIRIFFTKPKHYSYIEDDLYNVIWKWTWKKEKIRNLYCFCPKCEESLVYDDTSCKERFALHKETKFICEKCHYSSSLGGGDISHSLKIIEREINRKVRLNIYEK